MLFGEHVSWTWCDIYAMKYNTIILGAKELRSKVHVIYIVSVDLVGYFFENLFSW